MLQDYFKKWWKNFIQWGVVYLPTMTFFLWLAVSTITQMNKADSPFKSPSFVVAPENVGESTRAIIEILNTLLSNGIQLLLLAGLIFMGLKVAASFGEAGSGIGMKLAGVAGKGAKKLGWSATKGAWRGSGAERGYKAVSDKVSGGANMASKFFNPKSKTGRFAAGVANVATFGAFGAAGAGAKKLAAGAGSQSGYDKQIEEVQKSLLSGLNDQRLYDFRATNAAERAAKLAEISKRGKIAKYNKKNPGELRALGEDVRNILPEKVAKEIADAVPAIAPDVLRSAADDVKEKIDNGATPEDARAEIIAERAQKAPPAKANDWPDENIDLGDNDGKATFKGLTENHAALRYIVNNNQQLHNTVEANLKQELDTALPAAGGTNATDFFALKAGIAKFDQDIKDAKDRGADVRIINSLQGARDKAKNDINDLITASDDVKRLSKAHDTIMAAIPKNP